MIRRAALAIAAQGILSIPAVGFAQHAPDTSRSRIPASIRAEHEEIHDELARATKLAGRTGVAARALGPLASNTRVAAPAWLLPMTDSLRRELPRMLREHVAIRAATQRLGTEAQS